NNCTNKDLCVEKLSLVLPDRPPYVPREFDRCAVAGNSGDHPKTRFGKEIDSYEVNYTEYVGKKSTIRLLNRESARGLDKVVELDGNDIFFLKILLFTSYAFIILKHDKHMDFTATRKELLNPFFWYEFALSVRDSVDVYGFTVDPGYEEWTRHSSESRKGHTPLYGRAYYQMMECLGLIKIHSPMPNDPNPVVKWVPSRSTITAAESASLKFLR
ncbi:hypothetical protein Gogos_016226, partial [Gossypium gossypioides]|nr:hypothetical protein [Gossypium gossypioides]